MPPLLRSERALGSGARALRMLADFVDDLEGVDLDTVDGEFYWRCCRADLLERVDAICAIPLPRIRDAKGADRTEEADDAFAFLRQGLTRADALRRMESTAASLYPRPVWRRLLEGERIAMRAAELAVCRAGEGAGVELRLLVASGAWTGAEVETELVRQAPPSPADPLGSDAHAGEDALHIDVRFALVETLGGPCAVEVAVPWPLPPVGAVAREYDALVRARMGWHHRLPGGGTRQEKEVALRTWAVGLLVADGVVFGDAMDRVNRHAGLGEVSQTRFGQDRQRLVGRVPEAVPYLYARPQGGRALANPGEEAAPLQPRAAG